MAQKKTAAVKTGYDISTIKTKLATDQAWVEKAILKLFENQTEDEQRSEETKHKNGIGFSGCDGRIFSYYARYLSQGRHLSGKHLEKAFKRVPKYAGQILQMIEQKSQSSLQN